MLNKKNKTEKPQKPALKPDGVKIISLATQGIPLAMPDGTTKINTILFGLGDNEDVYTFDNDTKTWSELV